MKIKGKKLDEIVDVLDEQGNIIGQATREECHQDPLKIHAIVDIWLFNEKGEVLIQKQPTQKWDKSCGGHIASGHSVEETCEKEMGEELGVMNYELRDGFHFVEKYLDVNEKRSHLVHLFYGIISSNTKFRLDPIEVEEVIWVKLSDIESFVSNSSIAVAKDMLAQIEKVKAKVKENVPLGQK